MKYVHLNLNHPVHIMHISSHSTALKYLCACLNVRPEHMSCKIKEKKADAQVSVV